MGGVYLESILSVENKLGVLSIQVDDTGEVGRSSQCTFIGKQTIMPRKMKDLKFSRAPFPFRDYASSLQDASIYIKPGRSRETELMAAEKALSKNQRGAMSA